MTSDLYLSYWLAHFKNIPAFIEKLETPNMSLTSQLEIIKDLEIWYKNDSMFFHKSNINWIIKQYFWKKSWY